MTRDISETEAVAMTACENVLKHLGPMRDLDPDSVQGHLSIVFITIMTSIENDKLSDLARYCFEFTDRCADDEDRSSGR